jgi:hypothetical protein
MRDVHPLMTVMAGDIGRHIEARILEEAGERHRRLVQAYLSLERAGTGALVVDEEAVLANRLGLAHTGPELHPLLRRFLSEHGPDRTRRMQVPLAEGLHDAKVEPIRDGGTAAYSVRLLSRQPARPPDDPPVGAAAIGRWYPSRSASRCTSTTRSTVSSRRPSGTARWSPSPGAAARANWRATPRRHPAGRSHRRRGPGQGRRMPAAQGPRGPSFDRHGLDIGPCGSAGHTESGEKREPVEQWPCPCPTRRAPS